MTRRFLILVALLSVTMVVTGCDFFRVLAGRPTSKEIEAKRAEILRSAQDDKVVAQDDKVVAQDDKDSVPQQNQDSVQVVKPETAASERQDDGQRPHSAAAEQSEARMDAAVPVRPAGEKKRYYVIMGAFSSRENAEKYAERIKSFGYEPEFFGFTEGRTAVGVGGTDDPEEAKAFMRELKGQDFCPEGVWILDRKK
ncbi:MAG: SPOR domain-containing protein [Bacteroidales bacterium]|nr:SPOR domain-containing protein [Bacteroidales bacterium]